MRAPLLFACSALVALLCLWALRPRPEPPPNPAVATPAAPTEPGPQAEPAAAPPERRPAEATTAHGSITGTIVDPTGQAIPNARIALVLDDAPSELATRSGSDGHFLLAGAPAGAVAIRIEAAGFAPAQRGDLHPDREPDHHLDVGSLTLQPAMLWHGVVTCEGRGVPAAEVTLAPILDQRATATPLVQRTRTDTQGAFVFAQGPHPAVASVSCPGYRDAPPRRVDDPRQDLRFELVAIPRATGQVVCAEDGRPLPNALVAIVALRDHVPGEIRALGNRASIRLDAEARFDLELPDEPSCFLEVVADGRVPQARGPFPTTSAVGPLTIAMPAGVVVEGTVTWRGDPIGNYAQLWAEDGSGEAVAFGSSGGQLRLSPAPPGRWLLRIHPEHGALFERSVDLALPGPLRIDVAISAGVRLVGSVRGALPEGALVKCRHSTGWTRRGPVRADGTFVVEGLHPGEWTLLCDGSDSVSAVAPALLQPLLPPQTLTVRGESEVSAQVDSPAWRLGGLQGQVPLGPDLEPATIELVPTTDLQNRVPGVLRTQQADERGAFTLWPVLPGTWQVRLTRGSLRRTVNVVVTAGQTTTVTFPE